MNYIVKFQHKGRDWYVEWSSVVDAPITYGMPLKQFRRYYLQKYGTVAKATLEKGLRRVNQSGTSDARDRRPVEQWTSYNRAGEDGECLSYGELVSKVVLEG